MIKIEYWLKTVITEWLKSYTGWNEKDLFWSEKDPPLMVMRSMFFFIIISIVFIYFFFFLDRYCYYYTQVLYRIGSKDVFYCDGLHIVIIAENGSENIKRIETRVYIIIFYVDVLLLLNVYTRCNGVRTSCGSLVLFVRPETEFTGRILFLKGKWKKKNKKTKLKNTNACHSFLCRRHRFVSVTFPIYLPTYIYLSRHK